MGGIIIFGHGSIIHRMIIGFTTTEAEMIGWFLETKREPGLSLMLVVAFGFRINLFRIRVS